MKKIWMILLLAVTLTGCKTIADIKPDTIVDIPLHPTEVQTTTEVTTAPTEAESFPAETEPATEPPTEDATEKPGSTTSGGRTTGGKSAGEGKSGSQTPEQTPATEPPTQPPTDPPTEAPTEAPTQLPEYDPGSYDPSGYTPGSLDRAVADAVNARRTEAGLEPLTLDPRLCAIASVRAYELTLEWSHRRPDGSDGLTVLGQYGYGYGWAAENLFNGGAGGEKIVARWMTADSSAGNILSEAAAAIGVGTYTTADGLTCVAAIFAG